MKNLYYFRKTKLCLIVVCFLAFVIGFLTLNFSVPTFALETDKQYQNLIPRGELEQKNLTSPVDCYVSENVVAIIQGSGAGSDQSLYIYNSLDDFKEPIINLDFQEQSLKQVKKFSENQFIVSRNGVYVIVSMEDGSIQKSYTDGGTFFDLNSNYLVSSYGTTVTVYQFDEQQDLQKKYAFSGTTETPVAINEYNEIFFTEGSAPSFNIKKHVIGSSALGDEDQLLLTLSKKPTSIIANQEYCYVLEENLYRISLADGTVEELPVIAEEKFDLGNLVAPSSISFYGENLLICDSSSEVSAIQEFAVTDNGLQFTGFAIANGKTAYNRISKSALAIEKFIDYTVVLDEKKLTVINTNEEFTPYNRQSFYNFFAQDIADTNGAYQGVMPKHIALGKDAILLGFENKVKLLTLSNTQESCSIQEISGLSATTYIRDVFQQNGEFYILVGDGTNSWLYTIKNDTAIVKNAYPGKTYTSLAVTVKNQIFLSDGEFIYFEDLAVPYCPATIGNADIIDLATDLAGRLFVNDGNTIYTFDEQTQEFITSQNFNQTSIKHFALNYDSKSVAYVTKNSEFVRVTSALDNIAIDGLEIPTEYITQDLNAKELVNGEYQVYSVLEGCNLYQVEVKNQAFKLQKLSKNVGDYAFICQIETGITDFDLYAFASPYGTVLVDKNYVSVQTKVVDTAPSRVYITTKVNAYYLPIVTPDSLYSTVIDLADMQNIRIDAGTFVYPISTIEFLGNTYYFASYDLSGETRYCYIPVGFTVEIPYVASAYQTYTLEKVHSTMVYADEQLETEINFTLTEGQTIKVYKQKNGVCLIAFQNQGGEWVNGYISSANIIDNSNTSVRNFVIIVAVLVCAFGSSLFLILRKKNDTNV